MGSEPNIMHFKAIQLMREPVDGAPQPGTNTTAIRQLDRVPSPLFLGSSPFSWVSERLKCRDTREGAAPGRRKDRTHRLSKASAKPCFSRAWTFVEGTYFSAMRILLIGGGYFAMSRLLQGDSPSWMLVDQTLSRVLDTMDAVMNTLH